MLERNFPKSLKLFLLWNLFNDLTTSNSNILSSAPMEDVKKFGGVLLYVEDDRSLRATETRQGGRGRVQTEASVHSQLVSVCTNNTSTYMCNIICCIRAEVFQLPVK